MQSYALFNQNSKTLVIQKLDFYHLKNSTPGKKIAIAADGKLLWRKDFFYFWNQDYWVHFKLSVAGEDTSHGRSPWSVSSPTM